MKNRIIIIVLYCSLFFGVNTTGYSNLYSSSSASVSTVSYGRDDTGKSQALVADNGNSSFGGLSLFLGLLMLYYVKKLADACFESERKPQ